MHAFWGQAKVVAFDECHLKYVISMPSLTVDHPFDVGIMNSCSRLNGCYLLGIIDLIVEDWSVSFF